MSDNNSLQKKKTPPIAYIQLLAIVISYSIVFKLPYIVWVFYEPMQEAFGMDHQQIGFMMSTFGIVNLVVYLLGGILSDRFNPRLLMLIGFLGAAATGVYMSTIPSYTMLFAIQILYGIFTVMMAFPALLKTVRAISADDEQGRFYSWFEGGWKFVVLLVDFSMIAVFAAFGEGIAGLQTALVYTSGLYVLAAIILFFSLKNVDFSKGETGDGKKKSGFDIAEFKKVVKMPRLWVLSFLIMALYFNSQTQQYITAFFTEVMQQPAAQAATLFTVVQIGAPTIVLFSGFFVDKLGISRVFALFIGLLTVALAIILIVPGQPAYLIPAMISYFIWYAFMSVARGLYWPMMSKIKIPLSSMGTAIGIASIIGYSPDIFGSLLHGWILNTYGTAGYKMIYAIALGATLVATVFAIWLHKTVKRDEMEDAKNTPVAVGEEA